MSRIEGAAACELAGFGPEDPMADVCMLIFEGSCDLIYKLIKAGVKNADKICQEIHLCTKKKVAARLRAFTRK